MAETLFDGDTAREPGPRTGEPGPRTGEPGPRTGGRGYAAQVRVEEQPLAARVRPSSLADFVGQAHLLGEGSALRIAIETVVAYARGTRLHVVNGV